MRNRIKTGKLACSSNISTDRACRVNNIEVTYKERFPSFETLKFNIKEKKI